MSISDIASLRIGVLGGTGEQGRGLATRWASAGLRVILGSREATKALDVSGTISGDCVGMSNADCATHSDLVVIAVPWQGHGELLSSLTDELANKIVVDCVNPLGFDKHGAFALDVPEGSAAQQAQEILADSTVVAAFHHVSAVLLLDEALASVDTDVLVLGDDREATDTVQALARAIPGVRGIYGGRLRNAHQVEALTANLISINRRYRSHAGLRVTDVSD